MTDQEIYSKLGTLKEVGADACLATVVEAFGSTPRGTGAKMIVCDDGRIFGSVGGGCGEHQVIVAADDCLRTGGKARFLEVSLQDDAGIHEGAVCGGRMWIFIERI